MHSKKEKRSEKKMAHETRKKAIRMNCVDVDQINLELRLEQEKTIDEEREIKVYREPIKKQMLRLIKKARLNPKYLEEVISIRRLDYQRNFRNYGIH